jgi:MFS family permease
VTSPAADVFGDERARRRNFRLGVANGALFQGGEGFIDVGTVLPVLMSRLTPSNALIGFVAALEDLGWMLPQAFVVPWAARRPRQMGLYRAAALVRALALLAIAVAAWPLRHHPQALLAAFLLFYGIFAFGAGFGGVAFMEIVGRTVPPPRLGAYFAQRLFWGGLFAAGAGLGVREVLKLEDPALHFAILFGLATAIIAVALAAFAAIHEPPAPAPERPAPAAALVAEGLGWLRADTVFRRLLVARATLSVWYSAFPFMVLFAVGDLRGGGRAAGTFLLARTAGFVLSNLAWQPLSRRSGNRAILRIATAGAVLLLAAAVAVAALSPWGWGVLTAPRAVLLFEGIALLGGAVASGLSVGYAAMVIELAPPGRRQSFVSLMHTFLGPTMLLPALAGAVVDATSAPVVFGLCALAAVVGHRAATALPAKPGAEPIAEAAVEREEMR